MFVPDDYVGDVIGDLNRRRGMIKAQESGPTMVRIKADCNSGTGAWTSESPGQLQFAPIAATQAECGPESLHDRYMSQFQWVRSYVMKDGHLFLATMADGSIMEFEPVASAQ